MAEINLLDRYPRTTRDIASRAAAVPEQRAIAKRFEREYFDGDRGQGYGGYRYDGRWKPAAETSLVSESVLQTGQSASGASENFCNATSSWPQDVHRYS